MKKQPSKTVQSKSVKKQKQEQGTPSSASPKKSTSKKSETKSTSASDPSLDKNKPKTIVDLKAENLRITTELNQKNRELEIEASLERVRSRAMAMQSSFELNALISLVYAELNRLDIILDRCFIMMFDEKDGATWWMGSRESDHIHKGFYLKPHDHAPHQAYIKAWKAREKKWTYLLEGDTKKEWDNFIFSETELSQLPDFVISNMKSVSRAYISGSFNNFGCITTGGLEPLTESAFDILIRFAKVFDLTYTRFNDLKQAEAQALEARIEAALERVRSKALAMHTSKELKEVALELRHQMSLLGQKELEVCAIHLYEGSEDHFESWFAIRPPDDEGAIVLDFASFPKSGVKIVDEMIQLYKSGTKEYVLLNEGVEAVEWFEVMKTFAPESYKMVEITLTQVPIAELKAYWSFSDFSGGSLVLVTYAPPDGTSRDLLRRAAQVFGLAFRRFKDLKQAEAQARDAQIELSLERVRAKTMAMHNTQDVGNTVATMFQQLINLGVVTNRCGILIFNDSTPAEVWTAKPSPDGNAALIVGQLDIMIHPMLQAVHSAWEEKKSFFQYELKGDDIVDYYKGINTYRDYPTRFNLDSLPSYEVHSDFFFPEGAVFSFTEEPLTAEVSQIFKRFAGVFGQTYRRYLDLQTAEAQTREAQIQLALERVRARTMAMQHSDELQETAILLFHQMKALGVQTGSCGFNIWNKEETATTVWMSSAEGGLQTPFILPHTESAIYTEVYKEMKRGETFLVKEVGGQNLKNHFDYLFTLPGIGDVIKKLRETGYVFPERMVYHFAFFNQGYLSFHLHEHRPETYDIFKRFAKVFEQTYTRFLDLQKAEAQAREAQIELGLERVRARAMAMRKSVELKELIGTVFVELTKLDLVLTRCLIMIFDPVTYGSTWWMANSEAPSNPTGLYIKSHPLSPYQAYINAWKARENKMQYILEGKDKLVWDDFLFVETELSQLPDFVIAGMKAPDRVYLNASFNNFGNLTLASLEPLSNEHFDILLRFAKVFDLTYTRFNDLQKAEEQVREAKIEAALERVRSRSMGMQKSDELKEVIQVVYDQFVHLNIHIEHTGFIVDYKEKDDMHIWLADQNKVPSQVTLPYFDSPHWNSFNEAKANGKAFFANQLNFEEKNSFYQKLFEYFPGLPDEIKEYYYNCPGLAISTVLLDTIGLYIENFSGIPYTDEENNTLMRFGKVFQQTYTRFLDLQKAEEQAREAKIEAALERVRSRSMAMQKSDELADAAQILYTEFGTLGIKTFTCGYLFIKEEKNIQTAWVVLPDGKLLPDFIDFPLGGDTVLDNRYAAWKEKQPLHVCKIQGEENKEHHRFLSTHVPASVEEDFFSRVPDPVIFYCANFSVGYLFIVADNLLSLIEEQTIIRFAKVFEQTYTRFLDLQKAETQARESKIEAALEKVRSRSLAMHKAEELGEVITVVVEKLKELDFSVGDGVALITYTEGSKNLLEWMANPGFPSAIKFHLPYFEHPVLANLWKAKNEGADFVVARYTAEENKSFLEHIFEHSDFKHTPQPIKDYCLAADTYATFIAFQKHTSIFINDYSGNSLSDQEIDILKRFSKVFEQAYIRFLDLEKAEAQAREAKIESALEKIRSRSLAMHHSNELKEVMKVMFNKLTELDILFGTAAIQLFNEINHSCEFWIGTDLQESECMILPFNEKILNEPGYMKDSWEAKRTGNSFYNRQYTLEEKNRYFEYVFAHNQTRVPDPVKEFILNAPTHNCCLIIEKNSALFADRWDGQLYSEDKIEVLKRVAKVFEQAYIRFLDLQKAEAQAKEARIEASLERVRSKAMAMHSSRDLAETIKTIYQQIETLSVIPRRLGIGIINKDAHSVELTTMNSTELGDSVEIVGTLSLTGHTVLEGIYDNWLSQTEYRPVLKGNELRDYYKVVRPQIPYPDFPTTYTQYGYFFYFPEGGLYAWTEQEMSGDELQLYRRFSSVLSLTYKRYIDLKEAEAQARESSIQLALERVRARTMAMQRSEELVETSQLLFQEFNKLHLVSLGEYPDRAFIGIPDKSHTKVDFWSTDLKGTGINYKFEGNVEEPYLFNRCIEAWKNEEKSIIIDLDGMELASYLDYLKSIGFPVAESHYQRRRIHYFAFFSKGLVGISTAHQLPPETLPLLERFAGVFDLTYTRFLDLQKAEAQVRESKIELALERVRARTMAMQRSEELAEAAEVLFKQFAELGNEPDRISIGIIDETTGFTEVWATDQAGSKLRIRFKARNNEKTTINKMVEAWKAGKKSTIIDLQGQDLMEWIRYLRDELGMAINDENFNNRRLHQVSFFSQGWLNITTLEPVSDDVLSLLSRFAAVFNLTFTRFIDLKKAEAQTRQAHIETAMEKVRARSLAMQKPEELKEVAQVLRKEMALLGVEELETCSIYIHDETTGKTNCWFAIKDDKHTEQKLISDYMIMDLNDTWVGRKMLEFYHAEQQQTSILMQGEPRKEWIKYCIHKSDFFDDSFYGENIPDRTYHLNKFSNGYLGAASPGEISAESWELLKRATAVFSLAYTRFSDLQRSEANTREAVKQASMDRVRAEIASMRAPADLEKIIPLLWRELTVLGVPFIRCGVFIMDNPVEQIHTYLSTPEGKALAAFDIPYSTPGNISQLLNHWRDKKAYLDHWDEEDFREFAANLVRLGAMSSQEQYLATLPPGGFHLHFLPFLQGMLYVGNLDALQTDELNLIQSVADAFSTAYARYEDFNKLEVAKLQVDRALINLKQAQQQLVQSEKMASLGELTAGIAHEIQNPLNFVNNFSEVNTELMDEIKQAVQSGNNEEVLALAENVKQNLEKINFHGKRADGIVKSMLQHSRSSDQSGKNKKEPTDINALADEYLRLAYHGLRAKDKAFNATLRTDFDESLSAEGSAKAGIGLIEIVGQDIARAVLNLITNAFYAVHEKSSFAKASEDKNYEPTVSVSTKMLGNNIEIRVKDNGPGIPQHVLDKIFQPFFTTKPTGQGTGLGLSLAYDIVKAHGGDLKVVTAVGVGSEFIIELPVV